MDDSISIETDPFTFKSVGDQVTVHMEGEKITFSKKNSDEKRVIDLKIGEEEKKKLQFFVVLGESDSVRIVDM